MHLEFDDGLEGDVQSHPTLGRSLSYFKQFTLEGEETLCVAQTRPSGSTK